MTKFRERELVSNLSFYDADDVVSIHAWSARAVVTHAVVRELLPDACAPLAEGEDAL